MKRLLSPAMAAKADAAERLSQVLREYCAQENVPQHVQLQGMGGLHMDIVTILCEKKKLRRFETVEAAAEASIALMAKLSGLPLTCPVTVQAAVAAKTPKAKSAAASSSTAPVLQHRGPSNKPYIDIEYMHVYMYVSISIHISVCVYLCLFVCLYVCMYLCIYLSLYIYLCIYVCNECKVCMSHVCMYVCMHACMHACRQACRQAGIDGQVQDVFGRYT